MSDRIFNVTLVGDQQLIAKFEAMPSKLHDALARKVTALAYQLLSKVKGKLSGEVRGSAFARVIDPHSSVIGQVVEPGSVPYAAIHEFGGRTPPHEIRPI